MTNLQKAAEHGNQAAPNLLDAIKAGEVGGGGGGGSTFEELYLLILYDMTSEEDFTAIVDIAKQIPNIVIMAFSSSEEQDEVGFGYYTNYASVKDNIRLYFESAGAYSPEMEAIIDLIELDTVVLTTDTELVESIEIGVMVGSSLYTLGNLEVGEGAPELLACAELQIAGPAITAASPEVVIYAIG